MARRSRQPGDGNVWRRRETAARVTLGVTIAVNVWRRRETAARVTLGVTIAVNVTRASVSRGGRR